MCKSEYEINCLAMSIVNYSNEINNVPVEVRQKNNDKCFDFAVEKIKTFMTESELKYMLIWNDDGDRVWGEVKEFKNEDEFISQVKREYESFDNKKCEIENVEKQWMILTGSGLPAEMAIPITDIDIRIGQYYSADVYELEECE